MKEKTLLMDLGNSAVKYSLLEDANSIKITSYREFENLGQELEKSIDLSKVKRVFISSVTNETTNQELRDFLDGKDIEYHWVRTSESYLSKKFSLENAYQIPNRLGVDRYCAAIGAIATTNQVSLLVVQFGTATTVDTVFYKGSGHYVFQGGRILPGVGLMLGVLSKRTANLPIANGKYCSLPKNTDDAITTGVIEAQLGPISTAFSELQINTNAAKILVSGGHNEYLKSRLLIEFQEKNIFFNENLVIKGLSEIALNFEE